MANKKTPVEKRSSTKKSAEDRAFEKAERVLLKNCENILRRKGVTGIDVNYRKKNGKLIREIVIRVYVEKKLPPEELHPGQKFTEIDGVPIDVVESQMDYQRLSCGLLTAGPNESPADGGTPGQGGARIAPGHDPEGAGTLGILCFDVEDDSPMFLTNAHVVLGDHTKSSQKGRIPMLLVPLDGPAVPLGDAIKTRCALNSKVDCGLIEPDIGVDPLPGLPGLHPGPFKVGKLTRSDIRRKVRVKKLGQKTGVTEGIVDSVRLTLPLRGRNFVFQIGIIPVPDQENFSDCGDSGSIVLKGDTIVGLLHGTANGGSLAVASHIEEVVETLGIKFSQSGN